MSDYYKNIGCGGPTEFSRDVPPSPYYCEKCIAATGSFGPPVKRNFNELRMARKSSRQSPLSMNDKAHQLATLLHAILEQADLFEQVQAMYGEDSIEAASRLDLLIGVIQGAQSTVQRHNLTPTGIYKEEANG